jgi:hypothetical protein
LTFVTLDNKDWCKGIYHQGKLHYEKLPDNLTKTWKYAAYLSDKNVVYASLYVGGKSMSEVCPPHLNTLWEKYTKKVSAYHKSFMTSKVDLEDNCFFDLVPEQFLLEFCEIKTQIIDWVLENYKKPENYDLLLETEKILNSISSRKLNIDLSILNENIQDNRARTLLNRLGEAKPYVSYNLFGSKTGRLTTNPKTFPILNLDSKYRSVIKPTNDLFVELDYNAAEVRVLLGLSGQDQPQNDIHEWNAERLDTTREEAKKEIFSWLYGSKKVDTKKYESIFRLNKLLEQKYDGCTITSLYGRKIESDQFHSLNYLIQSSTTELFLDQLIKINKILENKKSFISFLVHDSVVIDLAKEDKKLINNILSTFSKTKLGTFPVNISAGKDYGSLRKL